MKIQIVKVILWFLILAVNIFSQRGVAVKVEDGDLDKTKWNVVAYSKSLYFKRLSFL